MDENEKYLRAKQRVEMLKSFYSHLMVYFAVNLGLFLINIIETPDDLWFYWVTIGWGVGVLIHAFNTFGPSVFSKDWEDRKIRETMAKEERRERGREKHETARR